MSSPRHLDLTAEHSNNPNASPEHVILPSGKISPVGLLPFFWSLDWQVIVALSQFQSDHSKTIAQKTNL